MISKPTSLMLFSKNGILNYIPNTHAVYYLRGIADENSLYPIYYIGKSKRGNLRSQLLEQFLENDWTDIVYINYIECDTAKEAKHLEKLEINRHGPKYNRKSSVITSFIKTPTLHFEH